ncbi:hypothetical protein FBUS_06275 [Fasciolopsis buskii]|uniref:Uncharacterized protein n=1 Tax=Fasciolopsis buskii TaxID=27845 RepID=A0A8E0RRC2_9TREM|nr:hypothetical protein FBUS_06275 [Fasciolopsis buski]
MVRMVKLWQTNKLQPNLSELRQKWDQIDCQIPAFLIYVNQLTALLENEHTDETKTLYNLCARGIHSIEEITSFHKELSQRLGHPLDPKGLHCLLVQQILRMANDLYQVLTGIRNELLHPIFQIRPGCENPRQLRIKERMCSTIKQLFDALGGSSLLNVPVLEIPPNWALYMRTEQRNLFGPALGFTLAAIEQLVSLDHTIDDYFQAGEFNHLISSAKK